MCCCSSAVPLLYGGRVRRRDAARFRAAAWRAAARCREDPRLRRLGPRLPSLRALRRRDLSAVDSRALLRADPAFDAWGAAIGSSLSYSFTALLGLYLLPTRDADRVPRGFRADACRYFGLPLRGGARTEPVRSQPVSAPEPDPGPRTVLVLPAWYPTARQPLNGPFVRDHARAAAAYGHRIVVLVDEGPSEKVRGLFTLREEQDGELRVVRLNWRPSAGRVAYLLGVLLVARRLARGGTPVDVLHAHVHRMGWPAVLAGRLLRRPVVISEHSSEWPRRLLTPGSIRRARIAFPRCARLPRQQASSAGDRELWRARAVPGRAQHGGRRRLPSAAADDQASSDSTDQVALHVEVKGLDSLLRAFAGPRRAPELSDARADRGGPADVRPPATRRRARSDRSSPLRREGDPGADRRSAGRGTPLRPFQPEREHAPRGT